ncbi:hypothetical protein [Pseudomonas sp. NFACC13-1]|uniref:hypothetical protein n=1 Tax=Pseudomonas sp. NFACC13-1 TaxID=1566245 RepID=UPI00088FC5FD|nr:hypothetical protein [Pseudomonas sp. NFACC13-1]SDB54390.1 hypothetical protein SAMN03159290_04189 [Pseudomonas sp. NFACC13-1]
MKLKTLKPLYLGGKTLVEGTSFLTGEQHGRELLQKGYAELDDGKDTAVVDLTGSEVESTPVTSANVATDPKSGTKAKNHDKKKAD